jgi:chorismate dehydratase
MLEKRRIDVGLAPVVAYIENPKYIFLDNCSISSIHFMPSVKMWLKKSLKDVKVVALDKNSLTSNALARIIFEKFYKLRPRYIVYDPSNARFRNKKVDAGVIIGDNALRFREGRYNFLDLGKQWHKFTRLPFVYALWLTQEVEIKHKFGDLFYASKLFGCAKIAEIAKAHHKKIGVGLKFCIRYLKDYLCYDLSASHIKGLLLFKQLLTQIK